MRMKEYEDGHERMENMLKEMQTPFNKDALESWKAIQNKINSNETRIVPFQKNSPKRSYLFAASIAALIALSAFLLVSQNKNKYTTSQFEKSIELPDGSKVHLLKNTSLTFSLDDAKREVRMYGNAIFEVSKGGPFSIQTKNGSIEVLGTTFLVECRNDLFNVLCTEGNVEMRSGEHKIDLGAGEGARLNNGTFSQYEVNLQVIENRKNGILFYSETPLKHVLEQLENEFDVKVILPEELKYKLYSGNFRNDKLSTALDLIAVPMGLSYEIKDDLIEFKE